MDQDNRWGRHSCDSPPTRNHRAFQSWAHHHLVAHARFPPSFSQSFSWVKTECDNDEGEGEEEDE